MTAKAEQCWTLSNDLMKCDIVFKDGSVDMTSLYNKVSGQELLTGNGRRHLFYHCYESKDIYANDGAWQLEQGRTEEIVKFGKSWGTKLTLRLRRTEPHDFGVTLVFELCHGMAGLRYQTFVKNNESVERRIHHSDVIALNIPKRPAEIHYVKGSLKWRKSRELLKSGKRNAIVCFDAGHGFVVAPENNYCTSMVPGSAVAHSDYPFLYLDIWEEDDQVRVMTNPAAVQLVLFPEEEVEYFAVNLTVFEGGLWEGRMAAAQHLRKRYKFHKTDRILTVNDWYFRKKRNETYYREQLVPALLSMGFDRLLIDDLWNVPDRNSPDWDRNFVEDLPAFSRWMRDQGLLVGFWYSLSGADWGSGRDLADPNSIELKRAEMEEILIGKYLSTWQQIDLGQLWLTDRPTPYSHPSDSVYRKWLAVRNYMNYMTEKYPDFLMQTTCELENPRMHDHSVGLLHLADNGIAGLFWGGERQFAWDDDSWHGPGLHILFSPVRTMFSYFGLFPSEGMLDFWKVNTFRGTVEQYYSFLLSRHVSLYDDPVSFSDQAKSNLKIFTAWWRNPRIKEVINEIIVPLYNGPDWNNKGPYSWMFTSEDKRRAILVAVGDENVDTDQFNVQLRWLASDKVYLAEDITLSDHGSFQYRFVGKFTGEELMTKGIEIRLNENTSRAKCYWLQEENPQHTAVLYADHHINSYEEEMHDGSLKVSLVGVPHATAHVITYHPATGTAQQNVVALDSEGKGLLYLEN